MKCEVPSFVSDFVIVDIWRDTQGNTYKQGDDYGKFVRSIRLIVSLSLIYFDPLKNPALFSIDQQGFFLFFVWAELSENSYPQYKMNVI